MAEPFRVGIGYDVHRWTQDRPLVLGGVHVPYEMGLAGHSDADVLTHAVIDALLGAAALGDIGRHFPDTDPAYRGADSVQLLEHVIQLLSDTAWCVGNIDATVVAERPKLAPFIEEMRTRLSVAMSVESGAVSVKATTTEGLLYTSAPGGVAAYATCLLIAG